MKKPLDHSKKVHAFKDGTTISQADMLHAKVELNAFYLLSGVPHRGLLSGRRQTDIWREKVYRELPETSEVLLNTMAWELVTKAPSGLSLKNLNKAERIALVMHTDSRAAIARVQSFRRIMSVFKSIAGRPRGWTLLGINSEAALCRLIAQCYGAEYASEVIARELFPRDLALVLLARKISLAAAGAPEISNLEPTGTAPNGSHKTSSAYQ